MSGLCPGKRNPHGLRLSPSTIPPMVPDVCIRGAGVVGRTLALLLARDRLRVGLVREAAPASGAASDVRAYALHAASKDPLAMLRAWALLRPGAVLGAGRVREAAPASGAASDVRAYALNAASKDLLEMLRAWPDAQHATPVLGMRVHGDEGA